MHDGLQADGYIELRCDWKAQAKTGGDVIKTAVFRINPWLAYGCGEGARLATRKPGATESTAGTLQRTLRDDYIVVRRDGSDSELTVDPTPFTVVPSSNPRHQPGTRLLIVHDGKCMDAMVEEWTDGSLEIKDGSRHSLKVEPLQLSGWVTMIKEGVENLKRRDPLPDLLEAAPSPEPPPSPTKDDPKAKDSKAEGKGKGKAEGKAQAAPAAPAPAAAPVVPPPPPPPAAVEGEAAEGAEQAPAADGEEEPEMDLSGVWVTTHMLKLRSGCDPTTAELGNLKSKLPVTLLERRVTPNGIRAYIATIPSESHIQVMG